MNVETKKKEHEWYLSGNNDYDIKIRILFINEMNRRKNSMSTTHIQQGISKFVEKSKIASATSTSENTGNKYQCNQFKQ